MLDSVRKLLVERYFRDPFPPSGLGDLFASLEHVRLGAGETLLRQGDPGNDLFLVLSGRLSVSIEHPSGSSMRVEEIGAGGVVGELALLGRQERAASVHALVPSDVARLTRANFERLAGLYPDALNEFLRRILPRLRRTQLVGVLTELFGELDEQALWDLESRLEWLTLRCGTLLFREGDAGDDVYIVVNGRLRVVTTDRDGRERVLEEVGRGGAVGEVALLTGEPRAASVLAVRDTDLLRLTNAAFEQLLEIHPRAMMQIARAAATRLRRTGYRTAQPSRATRSFALVPMRQGVPVAELSRRLAGTLAPYGTTLRLGSADVDRLLARPGIAQSEDEGLLNEAVVAWLSTQERDYDHLLLEADPQWSPWTRRCLRQADRVLLVASADDDPAPGPLETALATSDLQARCELVLLHADSVVRPAGTASWLAPRKLASHHHVRLASDRDLRRLARRISGRAIGLVLGGGGARGFAHVGVLRALAEADIEIDMVGGTSIGALIAAGFATELSVDEMVSLAQAFASPRKLLDRTVPITSLMVGRKVTALYREIFGDVAIEDLWMPLFTVSSDLTRAATVVHRRGPVWTGVRASTAIPAIFPPLLGEDNEVLVDGNVMNNMPLDLMREDCEGGTVIGVNPMPTTDKVKAYSFGSSLSGWDALLGRLGWFGTRTRAPSILGLAMRATEINSANRMRTPSFRALADLLIEPPVDVFPILEFGAWAAIIDIGYRAAAADIANWRASGADTTVLPVAD
jgi:NTE family protein/lysophospholipid hydrolase